MHAVLGRNAVQTEFTRRSPDPQTSNPSVSSSSSWRRTRISKDASYHALRAAAEGEKRKGTFAYDVCTEGEGVGLKVGKSTDKLRESNSDRARGKGD